MPQKAEYKIRPFDDLVIGEIATLKRTITENDLEDFAKVSQDFNPIHLDEEAAKKSIFKGKVVYGMLLGSMISAVIGTKLPGNGYIYVKQELNFLKPARIGEELTVTVKLLRKFDEKKHVELETLIFNEKNELLVRGTARGKAPF